MSSNKKDDQKKAAKAIVDTSLATIVAARTMLRLGTLIPPIVPSSNAEANAAFREGWRAATRESDKLLDQLYAKIKAEGLDALMSSNDNKEG